METLINDAFAPRIYATHIPTNTVAKNNQIIAVIGVVAGLIILGLILHELKERDEEKKVSDRSN